MDIKRDLISVSIPVLNEEANIEGLYKRLTLIADKMKDRCDFEFLFTDNRSDDRTWSMLVEIALKDYRVKAIRFSKNYGFQRSILANYIHTQGDAVLQIDADLQDPPELLESFYEYWKRGYQVVYGVRKGRKENFIINNIRKIGYFLIDSISEYPIPRNAGDFRLIDRKIIVALQQIKTPNPYLRGMIAGLGYKQIGLVYDREARIAGQSKFSIYKLVKLGITAVFNHSLIPLRIASYMGLGILFLSIVGAGYYAALKYFSVSLPQGLASIHILVLFGIGLNSFFLGIIGEYILRIYILLRSEPVVNIDEMINFDRSIKEN